MIAENIQQISGKGVYIPDQHRILIQPIVETCNVDSKKQSKVERKWEYMPAESPGPMKPDR